mmetsp:Transcript_15418/g.33383  ORF Transcript_15418/g.33383 Transcript_15418/m.33383 type:complete len:221 (-) Transcript_15418:514-1176(-)
MLSLSKGGLELPRLLLGHQTVSLTRQSTTCGRWSTKWELASSDGVLHLHDITCLRVSFCIAGDLKDDLIAYDQALHLILMNIDISRKSELCVLAIYEAISTSSSHIDIPFDATDQLLILQARCRHSWHCRSWEDLARHAAHSTHHPERHLAHHGHGCHLGSCRSSRQSQRHRCGHPGSSKLIQRRGGRWPGMIFRSMRRRRRTCRRRRCRFIWRWRWRHI